MLKGAGGLHTPYYPRAVLPPVSVGSSSPEPSSCLRVRVSATAPSMPMADCWLRSCFFIVLTMWTIGTLLPRPSSSFASMCADAAGYNDNSQQ